MPLTHTDEARSSLASFDNDLRSMILAMILAKNTYGVAAMAIQFSVLSCHLLPDSEIQLACQAAQELASQHCTEADLDAVFAAESEWTASPT